MSADELTERVAKRFPLEKSVGGLLDVTLLHPRVELSETDSRIITIFDVTAKLALTNKILSGTLKVSGRPEYVPEKRALYLRDSRVDRIRMDSLPDALSSALAKSISSISRDVLEEKPLHTFKVEDFSKYGARYTPERIFVRGDQLVLSLR